MNGPILALASLAALGLMAATAIKPQTTGRTLSTTPRSYRMGFSLIGPRFELPLILKNIDEWSKHADGAIDHRDVPWKALLSGGTAEGYVRKEVLPLMDLYRSRGFTIACTVDLANGIDRTKEAKELVEMGKSIAEPEVQKVYVDYVSTFAKLVKPDYLGLGSELNLIGDNLPPKTYDALIQMTARAAAEVKKVSPKTVIYVSAQVEWAYGKLPGGTGPYKGCEKLFRDFPFIQALGVSSYPAFAWDDPDQIPNDYYRKLLNGRKMPVIMVEGGWPSTDVPGAKSNPEKQAKWMRKLSAILDDCHASFIGLLTYTDLDLEHIPEFKGTIMPMFATMGMTDIEFKPKPVLTEWDAAFKRPFAK
jgi:hypothetical protein